MILGHESHIVYLKTLADEKRLSHGYLFSGPPRVGKRFVATGLARYLEQGVFDARESGTPVLGDMSEICPDETGTIGIDRVREARRFLFERPNRSPYRTVIVNHGEGLTPEAQNAFLKIAEEPPASALLIVVAGDPERLRETLISRLQRLSFSRVPRDGIAAWLRGAHGCNAKEAEELARRASGAPGLAAAFLYDLKFQKRLRAAENLLQLSSGKAQFVKDLVADPDFSFDEFLEALLIAAHPPKQSAFAFVHRLFALRREASYYNVNPRLQLTALVSKFQSS